jgi:hypothetical protein
MKSAKINWQKFSHQMLSFQGFLVSKTVMSIKGYAIYFSNLLRDFQEINYSSCGVGILPLVTGRVKTPILQENFGYFFTWKSLNSN